MSITVMKLALDALEHGELYKKKTAKAIAALRTAIEQAEKQEPVAWMIVGDGKFGEYEPGLHFDFFGNEKYWKNRGYEMVPVYTTPPAAQPCPYIRSTAEGTHHCALANQTKEQL